MLFSNREFLGHVDYEILTLISIPDITYIIFTVKIIVSVNTDNDDELVISRVAKRSTFK